MSSKILLLVPEVLPTFRADVAVLFGKYLSRLDFRTDVVGKAARAELPAQGFSSVSRPRFRGRRMVDDFCFTLLCLRKLIMVRRRDCHIIQVRDMVTIGLLAMLIAWIKGIPFCYWVSFLMCETRINRSRERLQARASLRNRLVLLKGLVEHAILYRILLPRAAHVFVQSDAMLKYMVGKGIDQQRMTAVPMGVDMELFGPGDAAKLPNWTATPVLAYLGSMDKERELHTLIDALKLVRVRYPQAGLLLIGSSTLAVDTEALLDYSASLGLSNAIHLTGWLPASQAWSLLRGADAAVSYVPRGAMYDVSSPTKLLEYLALGMPAVGNDTPDQAAVLTASGAGWLTGSNAQALATAMIEVIDDLPAARQRAAHGPQYIADARSYAVIAEIVARPYRVLLGTS